MGRSIFSQQLCALRKEKGITQEELANVLGVSPQAVSKWENGSYPDGDLLPRLADYFNVTIDYLYGRGERQLSVEQEIVASLQTISAKDSDEYSRKFTEKIMDYCWAMQIGAYQDSKWHRTADNFTASNASSLVADSICTFMRLGPDWKYYMALPRPKQGYGSCIKDLAALSELFAFLGSESNLKLLLYLGTLGSCQFVDESFLKAELSITQEELSDAVAFLRKLPRTFLLKCTTVGKNESIYHISNTCLLPFLQLLLCAAEMLDLPQSYSLQMQQTEKPLFQKEEFAWLKKGK